MNAVHWLSLFVAIVSFLYFLWKFHGWFSVVRDVPSLAHLVPMGMVYFWISIGASIVFACT